MTSFGTAGLTGPAPVRPDALRAYSGGGGGGDGGESDHTDTREHTSTSTAATGTHNAILLQQAATYAPLANVKSSSSTVFGRAKASTPYPSIQSPKGAFTLQQAVSRAGIPSFRPYIDRSSDHGSGPPGSHDEDAEDLQASIWNIAPRLSMSSAESSGGSEVKTPESISAQPSWRSEDLAMQGVADNNDVAVQRSVDAASPALFDMSEVARNPQGLAASGFEKANEIARAVKDPALVQAASTIDHENDSIHRSVTIKAKRPDSLLKLPSTSYQTDRTVTPSTSEPCTLQQGSTTFRESASLSEAAENVSDSRLSDGESSSESLRSPSSDAAENYRFPSLENNLREDGSPLQAPTINDSAILPPQSPPERSAASPDSWRSLLPEHDPYYARSEELTGRNSRAGSDALSPSLTLSSTRQFGGDVDRDDSDHRRWSHDSRKSTCSLPGPVAVLPGGGSWGSSSSLYDLDGTFNSSGSRAAFAPLQHNYNQSTRSLASPSISASLGGTAGDGLSRGAMGKIVDMVTEQQKRHASFSTFDNRNAQNRAALHHAPFVHPDYMDDRNGGAKGRLAEASQTTTASAVSRASLDAARAANVVGKMGIGNPTITCSDDGRENWPSSRNSLQSLPSPSVPGSSFTSSSAMKRTSTDASSLASELQRRLPTTLYDESARLEDKNRSAVHVGSPPPSVVSTSMLESVQPDQDGGVTTTRTTTTTTTTTMTYTHQPASEQGSASSPASHRVLSPKSRPTTMSDPQYGLGVGPPHQGATDLVRQMSICSGKNAADKPYEVSPLSPPTLPFLDSRPAPSSTDFGIETHATHYTLKTKLPGFSLDGITLATKHDHQLVIVADKWDESNGGHFERRINFGTDADLKSTRASFDGTLLKITVPRQNLKRDG